MTENHQMEEEDDQPDMEVPRPLSPSPLVPTQKIEIEDLDSYV